MFTRSNMKRSRRHQIRPSWRGALPWLCVSIIVSYALSRLTHHAGLDALHIPIQIGSFSATASFSVPGLVILVLMVRPLILLFDAVYMVGRHHLYAVNGILSLNRRLTEIPFEDMRGVRCEQTIVDRLLNIGTVIVWTAAINPPAIAMRWIRNPESVTIELSHLIDRARLKRPHAAPGQEQEIQHRPAV